MRYLIDTNIFVYLAVDPELLSKDVVSIIKDADTILCISTESVKELVLAYKNKGLCAKRWKTPFELIKAIENEYFITILPLKQEHIQTYSKLVTDDAHGHKDPSDHIIISHAITEHLPLISSDRRFNFYTKQGLDFIFNEK
ncbi:MAG: type II toxin-antitoxin system VapC family toxin [Paludibacteraceae bacterium]